MLPSDGPVLREDGTTREDRRAPAALSPPMAHNQSAPATVTPTPAAVPPDPPAQWGGPALFRPIRLRGLELANRVWVSPMCQYSAPGDGTPTDWHLVHLGSLAKGGAGLVFTEATSVEPAGRISPDDTGIWHAAHVAAWRRITDFVHAQGARTGIQLAHAGRKGSSVPPWEGGGGIGPDAPGGWETMAPSAVPFGDHPTPRAMEEADLDRVREAFVAAARRAVDAGFDVIELHAAHGYLLHQFLSPLSNRRTDRWGGDLAGRMRFPLSVVEAVREAWPDDRPLMVRVSATDWAPDDEPGWSLDETVILAGELAGRGVDLVDCSSGGTLAQVSIPIGAGYQVPFAAAVRAGAGIATAAVGMITDPAQAETIVASGAADAVFLARELLRHPTWPLDAARALGGHAA